MEADIDLSKVNLVQPNISLKKIQLSSIYASLNNSQLLHCHLIVKFSWLICRIGVIDTITELRKLKDEQPSLLSTIIIGKEMEGLKAFLDLKYVSSDKVYINEGMSIYKSLGFVNPGLLQCFGYCNKNMKEKKQTLISNFPFIKQGERSSPSLIDRQLGGSILINNKGKVVFKYSMKYIGDHCRPEELMRSAINYLQKSWSSAAVCEKRFRSKSNLLGIKSLNTESNQEIDKSSNIIKGQSNMCIVYSNNPDK